MSDCLSFCSKSNAEIKFAVCTEYIKNLFFFVTYILKAVCYLEKDLSKPGCRVKLVP